MVQQSNVSITVLNQMACLAAQKVRSAIRKHEAFLCACMASPGAPGNISSQLPRSPHTTRTARYRGGHGNIRPDGYIWPTYTWPVRAGAVAMARHAPGHPHARTSPPSLNWAGCLFRRGWMKAFPHWPWQCRMEASWTNCATVRVILFCISYYCDSH